MHYALASGSIISHTGTAPALSVTAGNPGTITVTPAATGGTGRFQFVDAAGGIGDVNYTDFQFTPQVHPGSAIGASATVGFSAVGQQDTVVVTGPAGSIGVLSSNPGVASISSIAGNQIGITANAAGTATITVDDLIQQQRVRDVHRQRNDHHDSDRRTSTSPVMRRLVPASAAFFALALSACGGGNATHALPSTVTATAATVRGGAKHGEVQPAHSEQHQNIGAFATRAIRFGIDAFRHHSGGSKRRDRTRSRRGQPTVYDRYERPFVQPRGVRERRLEHHV